MIQKSAFWMRLMVYLVSSAWYSYALPTSFPSMLPTVLPTTLPTNSPTYCGQIYINKELGNDTESCITDAKENSCKTLDYPLTQLTSDATDCNFTLNLESGQNSNNNITNYYFNNTWYKGGIWTFLGDNTDSTYLYFRPNSGSQVPFNFEENSGLTIKDITFYFDYDGYFINSDSNNNKYFVKLVNFKMYGSDLGRGIFVRLWSISQYVYFENVEFYNIQYYESIWGYAMFMIGINIPSVTFKNVIVENQDAENSFYFGYVY